MNSKTRARGAVALLLSMLLVLCLVGIGNNVYADTSNSVGLASVWGDGATVNVSGSGYTPNSTFNVSVNFGQSVSYVSGYWGSASSASASGSTVSLTVTADDKGNYSAGFNIAAPEGVSYYDYYPEERCNLTASFGSSSGSAAPAAPAGPAADAPKPADPANNKPNKENKDDKKPGQGNNGNNNKPADAAPAATKETAPAAPAVKEPAADANKPAAPAAQTPAAKEPAAKEPAAAKETEAAKTPAAANPTKAPANNSGSSNSTPTKAPTSNSGTTNTATKSGTSDSSTSKTPTKAPTSTKPTATPKPKKTEIITSSTELSDEAAATATTKPTEGVQPSESTGDELTEEAAVAAAVGDAGNGGSNDGNNAATGNDGEVDVVIDGEDLTAASDEYVRKSIKVSDFVAPQKKSGWLSFILILLVIGVGARILVLKGNGVDNSDLLIEFLPIKAIKNKFRPEPQVVAVAPENDTKVVNGYLQKSNTAAVRPVYSNTTATSASRVRETKVAAKPPVKRPSSIQTTVANKAAAPRKTTTATPSSDNKSFNHAQAMKEIRAMRDADGFGAGAPNKK